MPTLTERVLEYQRSGRGHTSLFRDVALHAYCYPNRKYGCDEDDRGDFLVFVYPKLERLIHRFVPKGSPFEAYLNATLRYQLRSYARKKACERIKTQLSCEQLGGEQLAPDDGSAVAESAVAIEVTDLPATDRPAGDVVGSESTARELGRGTVHRLLLLALKHCDQLEDSAYRRIAELTGCDPRWLLATRDKLRFACSAQRRRRARLRMRRDSAWFRAECIEREMAAIGQPRASELAERLTRLRRTVTAARAELRHASTGPSNRQLAEVLGVPKGTVDSGVFYLRRDLRQGLAARLEQMVGCEYDAVDEQPAAAACHQQSAQAP